MTQPPLDIGNGDDHAGRPNGPTSRPMNAGDPSSTCARCGQPHIRGSDGKPSCRAHVDTPEQPIRPCRNLPASGHWVCWKHGANAPQVKEAAARRLDLAAAIAAEDPRPPWQVLLDVAHEADVVWRRTRLELGDSDPVAVEKLDRLLEHADRAGRWAKTVLDAGIDERRQRLDEAVTAQLAMFLDRALAAAGLSEALQRSVKVALAREIRGGGGPRVITGTVVDRAP